MQVQAQAWIATARKRFDRNRKNFHRFLAIALVLPIFVNVNAPVPASAFTTRPSLASDGTCTQSYNYTTNAGFLSTGILVTQDGNDCLITFSAVSNALGTYTWVMPSGISSWKVLVVGGGGGGGGDGGHGGGGGELRYEDQLANAPTPNTVLTIQVGNGGAAYTTGADSKISWGGVDRYIAKAGAGGAGWNTNASAAGGSGGTGGTGTNGQSSGYAMANNACNGTLSATQDASTGNWYSGYWFFNGGGAAVEGLSTTAPTNSISGSSKYYGGAGGGGWGANINYPNIGVIYGLPGGGTVGQISTSGGRGANWMREPGSSTAYRAGASDGEQGVDGTGGGGGGGNACDPTVNSAAVTNGVYKRTSGGRGGSGVVIIRYTTKAVTITDSATVNTVYRNILFTSPGDTTWTAPNGVTSADILIVGGGGGGGDSDAGNTGGGGGAGGFYELLNHAIVPTNYSLTVGAGGTGGIEDAGGRGGTGKDSGFASFYAGGGGGGGSFTTASTTQSGGAGSPTSSSGYVAGGSGGGASYSTSAGSGGAAGIGTTVGGYTGANGFAGAGTNTAGWGGGGGGAGGAAQTGNFMGAGGAGKTSSITGTTTTYASGGSASAAAIVQNTGNGGSANYSNNTGGTDGASGIVAIRIKLISGSIGVAYPYALNTGEVLTATDTSTITAFNGATYKYQWQSASSTTGPWTNISGANSRTYTLTSNDLSKYMRVAILATDSYGTATNGIYSAVSGLTSNCVVEKSNLNTSTTGYLLYKVTSGSSCTWYAPEGTTSVDAFLVGGGGGGGADGGAGGGGGSINTIGAISLPANKTLTVTVGAGGTGGVWGTNGGNGVASSISNGTTTYTAPGGSGGGGCGAAASAGGVTGSGGTTVAGGAGGKGAPGCAGATVGDAGAAGPSSNFTGSLLNYGGGGGGGIYPNTTTYLGAIAGGSGGGGASARGNTGGNTQDGQPGTNGLGGGGGAGSAGNVKGPGGAGGTGVVYIKVAILISGTASFSALNTVQTRSDTFTVSNALDKASTTYSVSPSIANIVMETITNSTLSNWGSVQLVTRIGLTAGTYTETITATDKTGATSIKVVTITSYAVLNWDANNPTSVVTTFGKATRTRLNLSGGLGTRVAAITHMSSPAPRLVSIDTSTIASGYITLISDTATAPGSYLESITVIDGSNLRRTALVTITVNSPPDIAYTSATDTEYPLLTTNLFINYDFSNSGSYSGTGSTITDLKGNATSGTISSAAIYGSAGGGSVALSGGINRATIQYTPLTNTQSFSKFLWIYPTSSTGNIITICDTNCGYHTTEFELSSGVLYARGYYTGNANSGSNLVTLNKWHYVGFTWEYSSANVSYTRIYLDGKLVGSTTNSSTRQAPTSGEFNLIGVGDSTSMATAANGTFLLGAFQMYKSAVSESQVFANYANTKIRFLSLSPSAPTVSGNATLTMTEGKSATYQIFSEVGGTGTNTFSLSGTNSAISLASVGTDQTSVVVSSAISATNATTLKTYYETLTATDSASASTAYYLTINVNPKITITATTDTVTTTAGRAAYDTLTATYGTGTLTFSRTSGSGSSAITSTVTGNQAVLTIGANLPAGTYYETFTVLDSANATSLKVIKIVVNPALSLAVPDGTTLNTTITKSATRRINVYDGTDTRTATFSVTSRDANSGITLDQTNLQSSSGGYLTVNVGTAVPANTYTYSVSVRDNLGSTTSIVITIVVNKWPTIQNAGAVTDNIKLSYDASVAGSATNTQWNDLSTSAKNMSLTTGALVTGESTGLISFNESTTTTSYGTVSNFGAVQDTYSLETWIRISGRPTTEACIICESGTGNRNFYFFVRSSGNIGGNYYNGNWGVQTPEFSSALNTWYHVVFTVFKVGSNYYQDLYINGAKYGSTSAASTTGPATASQAYVIGKSSNAADYLKMSIPLLRLYGRPLTAAEVQQNYLSNLNRFASASSGTTNIVTTTGVATSSRVFTASDGTGSKTFTRTTSTSGLSVSSTSENTFALNTDNTLTSVDSQTSRTIYETVTATDSKSATSAIAFLITVNPPVIETATTTTITTTSGIESSTAIYATQGTGSKTFALSGDASSGVTLTSGTNQATLRVLSTINPGTYWETITATDTVGATFALGIKVIVNPAPVISGPATLIAAGKVAFVSSPYSISQGTGTVKFTTVVSSPSNGGITFDTVTATSIRIKAAATVESATTYSLTLTGVDALGAQVNFAVSLRVDTPLAITGTLNVSKNYGDVSVVSLNSSGGTSPFTIYAGPICTSEKSTYTSGSNSYTVEKFTGVGSCNWISPAGVTGVTTLIVGGGGAGGVGLSTAYEAGGGGAGGVLTGDLTISASTTYALTVGGGGISGTAAGASSAFGFTAHAGGAGGSNSAGVSGGSGGGGTYNSNAGGSATQDSQTVSGLGTLTGYGFAGGSAGGGGTGGGGGGGAGGRGTNGTTGAGGAGGAGISSSITGTALYYAGGGGGANGSSGTGGSSIGGAGGASNGSMGGAGTAGTGSGGGGSMSSSAGGLAGGIGGSGVVIIRYLTPTDTSTTNAITLSTNSTSPTGNVTINLPIGLAAGTYTETITVTSAPTSSTNVARVSTTATVNITVNKATPTTAITLPGGASTAQYGTPVLLTVAASTGGNVAFKKGGAVISGCATVATSNGVATCTWTPTVVETASITALLTPTDSTNYNNSVENASARSIVVAQAETLTVTSSSLTSTYSESSGTANTTIPARSFSLSGLATLAGDSITSVTYNFAGTINGGTSYPSSTTPPKMAGNYTITASAPVFSSGATTNYRAVVYTAGALTINRAARGSWTINYGTSNVIRYGAGKTETPTATYTGDGSASYSTVSSVCSVTSVGIITTLGVGSCDLQIVLTQTNNWLSDTKTVTVTILRGLRTATITPALTTIKYGDTTSVTSTISPALDSATVTYSSNGTLGCGVDNVTGRVMGIKALDSCTVKVFYDQTALYESTTATASITVNKALAPVVTTETITAIAYTGSTAIVSPSYNVTGIVARDISQILPTADVSSVAAINSITANTYSSVASYKYYATNPTTYDSTTAPSLGGTYAVTPQILTLLNGVDIGNYETPTYVSSNLVITPIAQAPLVIKLAYLESVTVPFDVLTEGGSSSGARTLNILSGGTAQGCSVDGAVSLMRLKTTTSGTCIISVTQAADRNYLAITSDSQTVQILNFVINILQLFDNPTGIAINHDVPFTTGDVACITDCVPTISRITDINGVDITTMQVGTAFRIIGTNFNTATGVFFTATLGGSRRSGVAADSFQIDSDTQITVMPPVSFVPNAGESVSSIVVRIYVRASGGQSFPNTMIVAISL